MSLGSLPLNETIGSVAVCSTEPIAIEGLRSLLESCEGFEIVSAETVLANGLEAVKLLQPAIFLLDKAFGVQLVLDSMRSLREAEVRTAVIVWGSSFPDAESLRFLQSGAAGVLRKSARLEVLLTCLRAVASGATWMENATRDHSLRPILGAHSPLTARELQVMELVERGMKNKDIGQMLGIRTGTVKIHLKHIFEKTGIRGRYGLAISGLKEKGLLVPELMEM